MAKKNKIELDKIVFYFKDGFRIICEDLQVRPGKRFREYQVRGFTTNGNTFYHNVTSRQINRSFALELVKDYRKTAG